MFEDSLIESTRHIAKRRGWTTLVSTGIQVLLMAFLIVLPLLRTNAISSRFLETPVVPPYMGPVTSSAGSHPPSGTADSGRVAPIIQVNQSQSSRFSHGSNRDPDIEGAPQLCTLGCGSGPGVPFGIGTAALPEVVLAKPPLQKPFPISHLDPGQIIRRVEPPYPPIARTARIQGSVILHAVISREGSIEKLQIISGHPMLDKAALDAVSQWRFRPYILNGQPIEVETQITINFTLDR
jgi:protein TonB